MLFYAVYTLCVASDIIDGPLARKTNTTSNLGALLDSAADFLLAMVVLFILVPILPLETWMLFAIVLVLFLRIVGFSIGFYKYRTFTMLHTYANKVQGLVLALFPLFFGLVGLNIAFTIAFLAAFISAIEELAITIYSKELDRNITWIRRV